MPSQLAENRFNKGMNKDLDPRVLSNQHVRDAVNAQLIYDGEASAYRPIKGSRYSEDLIDNIYPDSNILASIDVRAYNKIFDEYNDSIMFFGYSDGKSWIKIFDTKRESTYTMYETVNPDGLNFPPTGTISAKAYREGNVDRVYFTDNKNPIRVIDAISSNMSADYADFHTLTLQRYFPVDRLLFEYVAEGGELVAGSYQFAYRYVHIEDNRFSTWSLLTNPIPVIPVATGTPTDQVYGGVVGEATDKKIVLTLNVGESANSPTAWDGMYNAVQLAIVKRIDGAKTPPLRVHITGPVREWYNTGDIEYRGRVGAEETAETTISLEEFNTQQAPICTAKTLEIKNNILFAGNITYCNLSDGIDDVNITNAQEYVQLIGAEDNYNPSLGNVNTNTPQWVFSGDVELNQVASDSAIAPGAFKDQNGILPPTATGLDPNFIWKDGFELWPRWRDSETGYTDFYWSSADPPYSNGLADFHTQWPDTVGSIDNIYSRDAIINVQDVKAGNIFTMDVNIGIRLYANGDGQENDNAGEEWGQIRGSDNDYRQEFRKFEYTMLTDEPEELLQALESFLLAFSTDYAIGNRNAITVERVATGIRIIHNGAYEVYDTGTTTWNDVAYKNMYRFGFSVDTGFDTSISPNTNQENADPSLDFSKGYTNPNNIAKHKSYWRDEVYRFGIVFINQYGNVSVPKPLDFTAFNGTKDWHFSDRREEPIWHFSGSLKALGLAIDVQQSSIPSWAVAYDIVRMPRTVNIMHQTINVPLVAIQPATELSGNNCTSADEKASVLGTYAPKKSMIGPAQHMLRDNASGATGDEDTPRYEWSDNTSTRERIVPAMYGFPPTFMYNVSGTSFLKYGFVANTSVKVVDACSFFMTPPFDVDGSGTDDGDDKGDQLAVALRADNSNNYYYNSSGATDITTLVGFDRFFGTGVTEIKDTVDMYLEGSPYIFPTIPLSTYYNYKLIPDFYNLDSVVLSNINDNSQDITHVPVEKGAIFYLGDPWGDMTYLASDTATQGDDPYVQANLQFTSGYNVQDEAFVNSGIPDDNKILDYANGAVSAAAICNVIRNLDDDRYGNFDDVSTFIDTGAYWPTDLTPANTIVFGGDCFISKAKFKATDSHVGIFNIDECSHGAKDKIKAYPNWVEVYMYYVESIINCSLCADRFHYPVLNERSIPEFEQQFFYEYNPAYSAENDTRTFSSTSVTNQEQERTHFPARIVYSNTKVYQAGNNFESFLEGFDQFLPLSFYDLDETLGAITDMQKIVDNDMYVLQEHAVCQVPVNRSIIEDSLGSEMVINSDTVISLPRYYNTEYGCQQMRTVAKSGSEIYFVDNDKKEVLMLSNGLVKIGSLGMWTYFNKKLSSDNPIEEHLIAGYYDFSYDEYWLIRNTTAAPQQHSWGVVWNNKIKAWVTRLELAANTAMLNMIYVSRFFWSIGNSGFLKCSIFEMYTSVDDLMLASQVNSSVEIVVNDNGTIGKIFDVCIVDSYNRIPNIQFTVDHGRFDVVTSSKAQPPRRHDSEWVAIPKKNGRRLRGKYMNVLIDITNHIGLTTTIKGVLTKYRLDYRVK